MYGFQSLRGRSIWIDAGGTPTRHWSSYPSTHAGVGSNPDAGDLSSESAHGPARTSITHNYADMKSAPQKLSRRELEVASLVAEGLTSREIGQKLFISERTAEGHIESIRGKLGFHSRAEIAAWVVRSESAAPTQPAARPVPAPAVTHPSRLDHRMLVASGSAFALLAALLLIVGTIVPRLGATAIVQPIRTFAGSGNAFFSDDGRIPAETDLVGPSGVAVGRDGSVYFTDGLRIRKVAPSTFGLVVTIAGNGGGGWRDSNSALTSDLRLNVNGGDDFYSTPEFEGLAVGYDGSLIFPDSLSDRVRTVTTDGRLVTLAGGGAPPGHIWKSGIHINVGDNGQASASILTFPRGCAFDQQGNLYIADTIDNRIRRVDHATGVITTVAGTGTPGMSDDNEPAVRAELNAPQAVAVARDGTLYIADTGNERVRRVRDGVITTVAGTGSEGYGGDGGLGTAAQLDVPLGLALDSRDNLYIADSGNDRVRKLDVGGRITTVAGNGVRGYAGDGGAAARAQLAAPVAVAVDASNHLYIVDSMNNRIRVVVL
jgi:DNA-binding CsgD family transcriptional regulator